MNKLKDGDTVCVIGNAEYLYDIGVQNPELYVGKEGVVIGELTVGVRLVNFENGKSWYLPEEILKCKRAKK